MVVKLFQEITLAGVYKTAEEQQQLELKEKLSKYKNKEKRRDMEAAKKAAAAAAEEANNSSRRRKQQNKWQLDTINKHSPPDSKILYSFLLIL